MMATQQDRGHRLAVQDLWPRVMRVIEQAVAERIFLGGALVAKSARQCSDDGVNHEHRGYLAAAQDEVAYRPFLVDIPIQQALVYSFVAARHKDQMLTGRQSGHLALAETSSLR